MTVKPAWLAAAVVLAGWLIARRHKQSRLFQAAEVVAIAAATILGLGVIHLPDFTKLLEDAGQTLGKWTYLVVGVLAFAETGAFLGFIAPGETAVIVGGLVAGQGQISLLALIGIVWACCVAGDLTSYELGKRLGRRWLLEHGARVKITEERLQQVEGFFERHGPVAIIVGRFIGFVRPLMPFIAGASRMSLRRFLPYDVLAAGAWATTFSVLGYVFWRSIDELTTYVSRGLLAFGSVVVVIAGLVALVRLNRDEETRARVRAWLDARAADSRGWRLVDRAAGAAWRILGRPLARLTYAGSQFAKRRVTPGALGLDLTTLLALAAVSTFSFFALGALIEANPVPDIDRWAFTVADRLNMQAGVNLAKVVSTLGTSAVTGGIVVLTAAWALRRRRWIDAAALAAGAAASVLALHAAKAAYDRPRPSGSLVDTALSAYPSGHATYAVAWIACATILVRGGVGWAVRATAVTAAVVVVAVVALSRVYLRAHYLTDALGGVALGTAVWSLVGVLALFAGRTRHNRRATS